MCYPEEVNLLELPYYTVCGRVTVKLTALHVHLLVQQPEGLPST